MGKKSSGIRPENEPVFTEPRIMDFEKRRMFIPIISGSPTPHPSMVRGIAATYVVAASDAPDSWKLRADTLCTGTNDHLNIQGAIDAGYDVLLSPGTFNVEVSLALDSYNFLRGCGRGSILTTTTANLDIITAIGGSGTEKVGILLADFCIDGDAGGETNDVGILWTYVDDSEIRNVISIDNGESGIELYTSDYNRITDNFCNGNTQIGIYLYESSGNTIASNVCQGNSQDGIGITDCVQGNIVSDNVCQGNTQNGILIDNSDYGTVVGNTCLDNGYCGVNANTGSSYNSITGNTCKGNTYYGIGIDTSCLSISAVGNNCTGNTLSGIAINGAENNVVSSNTCRLNNRHGIELDTSNNNLIIGNNLTENSQGTTNTYDDIYLEASDYNLIQGNICRAGDETPKPRYGINISGATCDGNKVINNDLYDDGFGTGAYNNDGTGTIYVEPGIDDTPVNGETGQPISSNWAYDHAADTSTHGASDIADVSDIAVDANLSATAQAAIAASHTQGTDTTLGTLTADINMGGKDITNLNSSGGNAVGSTTAAWSLYVDAGSGSDENAGTSGSPKATIQGALDVLPINIAHAGSIKVRGQQNYAESNAALDFSRLSTLAAITIKTVNSSDEDMYDNGTADAGAGNNELDDATKDWSVDQFNGAYVWIAHGTGEGQIRTISDTTATKLTVSANWTTNPDGTSYYAIGGGATMTGSGANHVLNIGKLVNVYGFTHENASSVDVRIEKSAISNIGYNYFKTSVNGMFATWLAIIEGPDPQYNYSAATGMGAGLSGLSYGVIRGNVITGAAKGIRVYYTSMVAGSATAYRQNHIMNCTVGISIESGSGMTAVSSQSFGAGADANGADIDPAVSTTIPRWYD